MWKEYCVSIYGEKENNYEKIKEYLQKAKKYGATKVFTSAHIPESDLNEQIDFVTNLANIVHDYGLELIVDFGGKSLFQVLEEKRQDLKIDYIRLDCGYTADIMEDVQMVLGIEGFIWNASTIDPKTLQDYLKVYKRHPEFKIYACHNFYPRKETGLDEVFFDYQNKLFHRHNIPLMACLPNLKNPRKPLFEGLPTLERHRHLSFLEALLDLSTYEEIEGVLFGDLDLGDEEFQMLDNVLNKKVLELKVKVEEGLSKKEEAILFGQNHSIRYDSNSSILRSESSRVMAEFASKIEVFHTDARPRGSITIDNQLYGRYSGELQFVLKDLEKDERVNVVAKIQEEDLWKLDYYRLGFQYKLRKE